MKKLSFCLLLLLMSFVEIMAQGCLADGITFSTQGQVNTFSRDFPGCSHILGDVRIEQIQFGGITNLESLSQVDSISGDLYIRYNDALNNLKGLDKLRYIGGDFLLLTNEALSTLRGLENLRSVGGSLTIFSNSGLVSLSGLDSLKTVGDFLSISENDQLLNLTGLDSLNTVGDNFLVQSNASLRSLDGLENLRSIGRGLRLLNNSSMMSLSGFGNLESIGGPLRLLDNSALSSLQSLEKLDGTTITSLSITGSPLLGLCGVESICEYLSVPSNSVILYGNAIGCSTRVQIETACLALVGREEANRIEVQVYPNPSKGLLEIQGLSQGHVQVLNPVGQLMLEQDLRDSRLDLTDLSPGLYFLQITAGEKWAIEKIVKE